MSTAATTGATTGPLSRPAPPRGPGGKVTARASARSRGSSSTAGSAQSGGNSRGGASSAGVLRFYTDEAPGLRVGPQVVLVSSLAFIGVVVLLHIWAKFTSPR